jgi:hypothetical protein
VRSSRRPAGVTLASRPHLAAALLLSLIVVLYLWPVLVGGKILSPIADLYGYVPWHGYAPSDVQAYSNPLLVDIPREMYPWRFLARLLIREGTFPAWSPYELGGVPLFANPQAGVVSLFNVPLWILPLTYGLGVSAALKLAVGAFGAYLLARQLRLGFLAGLLAGVAFAFCAINVVWLVHAEHPGVVVMLPWAILLVERVFERGRVGSALALTLVTAIGLGGGHPGMQVHFVAAIAVYALARAVWPHGGEHVRARSWRVRALGLVGGALLASVLLMAFMLLPELRSADGTVGVLARRAGELPAQHMPFTAIETVLFPDRWGRPSAYENATDLVHNPFGVVNFNERTFYAGVVALLLACVGLVSRRTWRRTLPFALIGVLGLAVALRVPGPYWLATHLPGLDSVEPERLHFAFEFAVALLAAFGLQALIDAPAGERRRLAVPAVALLVGAFALASTGASWTDAGHTVRHFLIGVDYRSSGVLALTSVVWFLLFALGVGVALLLARRRPERGLAIGAAVVVLAAADAFHFAHGLQPMGPAAKVIPPVTPAIAYLERHRSAGRIVGLGRTLPADWGIVYGLEDVRGYDPPQPTRRMLALWRIVTPGQPDWTPFEPVELSPRGLRVLTALGTRYVVLPPDIALPEGFRRRLRTVYRGSDALVVENAVAVPRALVPSRVLVTSGEAETDQTIAEAGFDARTTVAVEREQPGAPALTRSVRGVDGSAAVVQRRDASVTLRAQLDRRGLVVLNEALLAGWTVRVDGRPAPALHANSVMRGVLVPAGRHTIVWSYATPGLRLGALASLLTLVGVLGGALALALRSRRRALATWRR